MENAWRLHADLVQKKVNYENARKITFEKSVRLLNSIRLYLSQYKLMEDKSRNGDAVTALRKQMKLKGQDPLEMLKLKESILENDLRRSQTAFLIRRQFIEFMSISGRLTREPLTNYLSYSMEKILAHVGFKGRDMVKG